MLNTRTGKSYIGQSLNMRLRKTRHKSQLKHNKHINTRLQNSANLYGYDSFVFEELFTLDTSNMTKADVQKILNDKEKEFILVHDSIENGYNLTSGGDGHVVSEETRTRLKLSHKGHRPSDEHMAKLHALNKGRPMSHEQKCYLSKIRMGQLGHVAWNKGASGYKTKPASEERKRKIGEAQKGNRNHNFGKKTPDDVKQKCRDSYHGSQCHLSKLNDDIVKEIKADLASGVRGADLARKHNVSQTAIYEIKTGRTWKHILNPVSDIKSISYIALQDQEMSQKP